MIQIAEVFQPVPGPLMRMIKQCGIRHAVGGIDFNPIAGAPADDQPVSLKSLLKIKAAYEDAGFSLDVIQSRPPL